MDETSAYLLLEQLRWGGRPGCCPHCGVSGRCYFLHARAGTSRSTRTGARTARRVWKCGSCRQQFSVLKGTVLEGTRAGVTVWVHLIADVADGKVPSSLRACADRYHTTPRTIRHIVERLDRCAALVPGLEALPTSVTAAGRLR